MKQTRRWFLRMVGAATLVLSVPGSAFAKIKKMALPLTKAEKLKTAGGWALLKIKGKPILFIREDEKSIHAVSGSCSHKACALHYNSKSGNIDCECHGSSFTKQGKVINGPATKDLPNYNAVLKDGRIIFEMES